MDRFGQLAAAAAGGAAVAWVVRSRSGRNLGATESDTNVLKRIKDLVARTTVVVFSKTYCPYCREVKALFKELEVGSDELMVVELDVSADGPAVQAAVRHSLERRTLPRTWNVCQRAAFLGL